MDFSKKNLSPTSCLGDANRLLSGSERKKCTKKELTGENDENCEHVNNFETRTQDPKKEEPKMFMSKTTYSTTKKKILNERNDASDTFLGINLQLKPAASLTDSESSRQIIRHSIGAWSPVDNNSLGSHFPSLPPYDPATNYTSPRPEFLRYNPNRKREILSRIAQEMEEGLGYGFDSSSSSSDPGNLNREESSLDSSVRSQINLQDDELEVVDPDDSDFEDNDEIEDEGRYTGLAWKLFLLFGVLLTSSCHISSMNSNFADTYSRELGVIGENLKNTRDWAFPRIPYIETMLGFSSMCLDVGPSEVTCRVDSNFNEGYDYERKGLRGTPQIESFVGPRNNSANEADDNKGDALIEDETLSDVHSVADGKSGETAGYDHDSIALGRSAFEVSDVKGDSDESDLVITDEISQAVPIEITSSNSTVDEGARSDHIRAEADETSSDDRKEVDTKMRMSFSVELEWPRYMVYLIYLLMPLLMIIGLSSLHKHSHRSYKIFKCPSKVEPEEIKISSEVSEKGKTAENAGDLDVPHKPLENSEKGYADLNGTRPPKVELLAEFSVSNATNSKANSVQRSQRRGIDSSAESQLSQRSSSVRKNTSTNESSLVAESDTDKSSGVPKLRRKEETGERVETAKAETTTTPLRRSSRLRNRVTQLSPP